MSISFKQTSPFFAEFFGTFIFLLLVTLGVSNAVSETNGATLLTISTVFGLALTAAIYIAAPISGGHINPAVTIAFMACKKLNWITGLLYITSQIFGAISGSGVAYLLLPGNQKGAVSFGENVNLAQGFFAEMFGTMILVLVVFGVAVHSREKIAPLIIGLTVFGLHIALVPITGCGINPARFLGTNIVLSVWDSRMWVYILGPIFGSLIAIPLQYVIYDNTDDDNLSL